MRKRRTARVLLFDSSGAILLIHFVVSRPDGEFAFWATPGGEVEDGETETVAAQRELQEELGLSVEVEGPIRVEKNSFWLQGEMRDNTDFFFRAQCDREAVRLVGLTPEEIRIMKEIRWWAAEEIASSGERFFPQDLVSWLMTLIGDRAVIGKIAAG